jgi:cell division protein ZapA
VSQVSLSVNGRVYRVACDDGEEEHVAALGARFDQAIQELRAALGEIGDQRLMVMAGILMTDRLDEAERRIEQAEGEIKTLKDSRANSTMRADSLEESFVENLELVAERLEKLTERLYANPDLPDDIGA